MSRKLDGDETGMFNRLHKTVSDALMTMVRAKRLHFRRQYDGDEQDQSLMRSARRKVQADKERPREGGARGDGAGAVPGVRADHQ